MKDGVCGRTCMWLIHMVTCSPLKDLKSTWFFFLLPFLGGSVEGSLSTV